MIAQLKAGGLSYRKIRNVKGKNLD
jgi:hypothetical protein